jgi:predicted MPP superfamily phosphohydrolase
MPRRRRLFGLIALSPRIEKWVDRISVGFLVVACLVAIWAFAIEPNRLVVRQVDMPLLAWPTDHAPLRVALLSDLHVGAPFVSLEKIDEVVETINRAQPDLVILLGDYIPGVIGGDVIAPETFAENLSQLSARLGVYAVLGIHDWFFDGPRVAAALRSVGIVMIDNHAIRVERAGGDFWLGGLGDFDEGQPDIPGTLEKLHDGAPAIFATHNPDLFPLIPQRIALMVAGHTHGGQVYLPLIGAPAIPSAHGDRYAHGHFAEDGKNLYVTAGLGTTFLPMRFLAPPEVVFLTIRSGWALTRVSKKTT